MAKDRKRRKAGRSRPPLRPHSGDDRQHGGSSGKAPETKGEAAKGGGWSLRRAWERLSPRARRRLLFASPALPLFFVGFVAWMIVMPGTRHRGPLPPLDDHERTLAGMLRFDVTKLAGEIGERNVDRKGTLDRAWNHIEDVMSAAGYELKAHRYTVDGRTVANLEAVREGHGRASEIVVVGAHYDSAQGAPGADDNASGVAVLLALARAFDKPQYRTIRFVAFVNEEPPHFESESMGSLQYAKACKARGDDIVAMISLESLGYYRDEPGTQKYPPIVSWFYPDRGDFVAFVGNVSSGSLVREAIGTFRSAVSFPSEGAALPSFVPGVGWSDHWSFWKAGYPAIMVTDTALFRNPNYHTPNDKPETLDYERLARVTSGLIAVVGRLAR